MKEATKKVIIELKEVKKQRKLSCSDIVELVENNNDTISPSTVRRMFAKGSEDGPDFRPYSINSVVRALVGKDKIELTDAEEASLTEAEKEIITENSALRAAFDLNEAMIEDLRKQIINQDHISSLIQLEYSGFDGATVPICTFVLQRGRNSEQGSYIRLSDFPGAKQQAPRTREIITAHKLAAYHHNHTAEELRYACDGYVCYL